MLQKSSISKTLEIFFEEPNKRHYLLDISRKISLAHTSVKNNLDKLTRLKLIKKEIEEKASRKFPIYTANTTNKSFKELKIINNMKQIRDSNLIKHLETQLMPKSIVLFGSYHRGEDDDKSDIDLFIECEETILNLEQYEKKLKRKIQLHFNKKFKDYPKDLKNNIINGAVLHGFLEGY